MLTLADRAATSLSHHPAPALPLTALIDQMRGTGAVVGPEVLLRALEARPDLFRVLNPWRGPWRARATSRTPRAEREREDHWVIGLAPTPAGSGPANRLKASLAHLGRTVDERSVTDLVRWLGMVREGERLGSARVSWPEPRKEG